MISSGSVLLALLVGKDTAKFFCSDEKIRRNDVFEAVKTCLLNSGENGLNTRQIADQCDISICSARYFLLKLKAGNAVTCDKNEKCHKWYLAKQ